MSFFSFFCSFISFGTCFTFTFLTLQSTASYFTKTKNYSSKEWIKMRQNSRAELSNELLKLREKALLEGRRSISD